jgi:predicted DNA-binding transcriptional regulator AlpA
MKRDTKGQAARLGVQPKTLDNWRSQDVGPPYYKIGGRVVYDDAEVDAWVAERRVNPGNRRSAA